ncbi:hypothetical protein FNV43_RR12087 [Rhamnella rubrinervis]|uniref:Homeobox domain-containing protein n=1 Tax=Rhamnella rubrinervis TaxID=2594499 RepID=A0A8K0H6W6_9ROSA|nr:hypothetical protein FNV43_RR12087 [Rhamnella rubrinervis]
MEYWQLQEEQQHLQLQIEHQSPDGIGGLHLKVMTDEQMELLRRQISMYSTICEQLVEMHKAITAQQDLPGMRLGILYCDPSMSSAGHKITTRQRWTPTPLQLQILEQIFDDGIGTPSKPKIKEITTELSKHGQISETNVYNWFQNRRARSKKKQSFPVQPNNVGSQVETEDVVKPENIQTSHENSEPRAENSYFLRAEAEIDTEMIDKQHSMFASDYGIFQEFRSY